MKLKRVDFIHPVSIADLGQVTGIVNDQQGRTFDIDFDPNVGLASVKATKHDEVAEIPITNIRKMVRAPVPKPEVKKVKLEANYDYAVLGPELEPEQTSTIIVTTTPGATSRHAIIHTGYEEHMKPGDIVVIRRGAGVPHEAEGRKYTILKVADILAVERAAVG